jgi:hypothetical protein
MPCWNLIANQRAIDMLKSKGISWTAETGKSFAPNTGFQLLNQPVMQLINALGLSFQNEPPFIDNTMISGNIDIEIAALLTDFEDVKKALRKNGLDLVKGKKKMSVIVIRDPKPVE